MMKLAKRHKVFLTASFLCLASGFFNYLIFSPRILLLGFLHIAHPSVIHNALLRHIITGYLSDALWVCALCLVTIVFTELQRLSLPERMLILLLPVVLECAQYFQFLGGTFDLTDIAVYTSIILVFIYFFPGLISLQNHNHEKIYS